MLSVRPCPIEKESSGVTYYDSAVNEKRDAQSSNAHGDSESYVEVSVLPSGGLTLPEHFFCADQHDRSVRTLVPSMSFLLFHPRSGKRLVFDLGMRKDLAAYPKSLKPHLETRVPIDASSDVSESLLQGGLEPSEIDAVILSHVHYDHVGTPSDFTKAQFIVGHGTRHILQHGMNYHSASHFEADLLPPDRIIELPVQSILPKYARSVENELPPTKTLDSFISGAEHAWRSLGPFENAVDIFGDGLIYIIDSPGHLPGHLNVVARVSEDQWVYLAGDACHHSRILDGETEMATWKENGMVVCIHADRELAFKTVGKIKEARSNGLLGKKVEVVLAHDGKWYENHRYAIWPRKL